MRLIRSALIAALAVAAPVCVHAQDLKPIVGDWYGALNVGVKLPVVLHVKADGTASLDSPSQGAMGMPATASLKGSAVTVTLAQPPASFEGVLAADGASLGGQWKGAHGAVPLILTRTAPAAVKRPQTPRPPFPYRAEEVGYLNPASGLKLAGTLTLPAGQGPFPVALLITGSGTQDRDETIFDHKPFLVLADALTRKGVAVLRVDDRGAGGSQASAQGATLEDIATDVAAGVAWLRTRPDLDPARIGLIGHSEGAVVAVKAAAADPRIAFVVMMAGTGVDGRRLLVSQVEAALAASGAAPAAIETAAREQARIMDIVASDADDATVRTRLAQALGPGREASIPTLASPAYRSLIRFDPRPSLARIRAPVLAIGGSKDTQVPAAENLPAIKAALAADHDVTTRELPGLNHLFQTAGTGLPQEYGEIEETLAPSALDLIVDWTATRAKVR
jgi:pimeloyl-ACP methyl ester carboxylesterase